MTPSSRRGKDAPGHEHRKAATARASHETAEASYNDPLKELSGELRYRLASQSRHPAELARVASALQDTIDSIRGDASSDELRNASTRLVAEIGHAQRILMRLTVFSGELEGIAWIVEAGEEVEANTV